MTRKDYVATAEILETLVSTVSDENLDKVFDAVEQFADYFESDNPRFMRDVFLCACNVIVQKVGQ